MVISHGSATLLISCFSLLTGALLWVGSRAFTLGQEVAVNRLRLSHLSRRVKRLEKAAGFTGEDEMS